MANTRELIAAIEALLSVVEPNYDCEDSRTSRAIRQAEAALAKARKPRGAVAKAIEAHVRTHTKGQKP